MSSHATTLTDILHVKQVSMTTQQAESAGLTELLDPGQQAKVSEIDGLLIEVGAPTVDEELDATITALTDMRDDVSPDAAEDSAYEGSVVFKMSYNAFERFSMFSTGNYHQRAGSYVWLASDACSITPVAMVTEYPNDGSPVSLPPYGGGIGMQFLRPGRYRWEMYVTAFNLPTANGALGLELYDPTGVFRMAAEARLSVDDPDDPASWWPPTLSVGGAVELTKHGVAPNSYGIVNVFNPGDASPSVAALVSSIEVSDVLQIWLDTGIRGADPTDLASIIFQCTVTQLDAEPRRGEPTPEQLAADLAMRENPVSGLALAKAADAEAEPT